MVSLNCNDFRLVWVVDVSESIQYLGRYQQILEYRSVFGKRQSRDG